MATRHRPFTAEKRQAELSGSTPGTTNDDLLQAFNDLSQNVRDMAERITAKLEATATATAPPAQAAPAPAETAVTDPKLDQIKQEIAALKAANPEEDEIPLAREELGIVVEATDSAANDIMNVSEELQNTADKIRDEIENGNPDGVEQHCASLEEASTNLLMACSFQDLTGQRINKVVNTLSHLEHLIDGLFEALEISRGTAEGGLHAFADDDERPDTDLLHGPQNEGEGISQAEIDAMFD